MEWVTATLSSLSIAPGNGQGIMEVLTEVGQANDLYPIDLKGDMRWKTIPVSPETLLARIFETGPIVKVKFWPDPDRYGLVSRAEFYQPGA